MLKVYRESFLGLQVIQFWFFFFFLVWTRNYLIEICIGGKGEELKLTTGLDLSLTLYRRSLKNKNKSRIGLSNTCKLSSTRVYNLRLMSTGTCRH